MYFDGGLVKVSLRKARRLCNDQNNLLNHRNLNLFNDAEKIGENFFSLLSFREFSIMLYELS